MLRSLAYLIISHSSIRLALPTRLCLSGSTSSRIVAPINPLMFRSSTKLKQPARSSLSRTAVKRVPYAFMYSGETVWEGSPLILRKRSFILMNSS